MNIFGLILKNSLKQNKKTQITAILFFAVSIAFAQKEKPKNLPNFDKKLVHFGFSLGINTGNTIIKYNADKMLKDSLLVLEPVSKAGYGLGIVTDLHLGDNFDLRFIPSLSFVTRELQYTFCADCKKQFPAEDTLYYFKQITSTQLDFPLLVKFKSARVNNYRWYMLAGMRYSFDLESNKDNTNATDMPIKFEKTDLAYELGLGLDFYLNYFKFSPEIKFSFGTKNMLIQDNTTFSSPIQSLRTKTIFISFLFE
jgi:hypothetical protein